MVQDAETADALPLLAFTLRKLYDNSAERSFLKYGRDRQLTITIDDYEKLEKLDGAVRQAADGIIKATNPTQEEINALHEAFVPAMVRFNSEGKFVRRRAPWDELPAAAHRLLRLFIEERLLGLETESQPKP